MIAIVDYGLGNVQAFANIYQRLGVPNKIVSNPSELESAAGFILPGVGAFDWAITMLNKSGLRDCLHHLVCEEKRPFLGVCVGMQLLCKRSQEGNLDGLGWLDGEITKLDSCKTHENFLLPHMGWNTISDFKNEGLFNCLDKSEFYFLHSYCFLPQGATEALATANYGRSFVSAVKYGNIFGVQFHPEKSHGSGITVLKNFYELTTC